MRKVIYQQWIPEPKPTGSTRFKLSEKRVGFFHHWGLEIEETSKTISSYSVAIIEDEETKKVLTTHPHLVEYIDSPITTKNK